jgi:hypothetical protein
MLTSHDRRQFVFADFRVTITIIEGEINCQHRSPHARVRPKTVAERRRVRDEIA